MSTLVLLAVLGPATGPSLTDAAALDTVAAYMAVVEAAPDSEEARLAQKRAAAVACHELDVNAEGDSKRHAVVNRGAWPVLLGHEILMPGQKTFLEHVPPARPLLRHAVRAYRRVMASKSLAEAQSFFAAYPHSPLSAPLEESMAAWIRVLRQQDPAMITAGHVARPSDRHPGRYRLTVNNAAERPIQVTLVVEGRVRMVTLPATGRYGLDADAIDRPDYAVVRASSQIVPLPVLLAPVEKPLALQSVRVQPVTGGVRLQGDGFDHVTPLPLKESVGRRGRVVDFGHGLTWISGQWVFRKAPMRAVTPAELVASLAPSPEVSGEHGPPRCVELGALDEDARWRSLAIEQSGIEALENRRPARAARLFEQALGEDPSNLTAMYNAACAHTLAGQHMKALSWLATLNRRCEPKTDALLERAAHDPDLRPLRNYAVFEALTEDTAP